MKLKVYSVHDKAVNAYMQPFYCRSKGEAIRSFTEACSDGKSNFCKYPLDYLLVELGEFDDSSGLFESREPMRIVSATEVRPDDEVFTPEKELPRRVVM
ncbi:MAG: nonstructural protein [Microvirus sp.]|nr:MAG: nonstructural protein [Microvirus sp.]